MDAPRMLNLRQFCRQYGIGLTTAYEEINAGRLQLRKIGKASRVLVDDAEAWAKSRPTYQPTAA